MSEDEWSGKALSRLPSVKKESANSRSGGRHGRMVRDGYEEDMQG